jgi:hypothetical protein
VFQGHPVEEIIGVWEHRDEYLGRIHKGRRLGIGPEPDNRHINTGNTVDDFQVHANDWFDLHWLSSQKGDLVLVWHWSVWWHAIVKYVARRKGTLTIAWPDRKVASGFLPRCVKKVPAGR